MKPVFRSADVALVDLYRSMLRDVGIETFVLNETLQQSLVAGIVTAFLPLPLFWPTLCVIDDRDHPAAIEILRHLKEDPVPADGGWQCPQCGEEVPANFTSCWKCSTPRAEPSPATS